jgi:uncharacterized membrane protein YgdD (TMEM256/DUF423 family)
MNPWRVVAGLIGASGILAAAFGAHGLEKITDARGVRLWAIAAALELVTAPALLWLSSAPKVSSWSGPLLTLGLCLFCGTLYAMALGAPKWLGAVTPLGGLLLTAGWLTIAFLKQN